MVVQSARSYTLISIVAAILTIVLKFAAYRITNSVGLLSDALESGINLIAAVVAFWALSLAAKPPDEEHMYGHSKAEYFSSGLESALIIAAAIGIIDAAWGRLLNPQPLEQLGLGLGLVLFATLINGGVSWVLFRAGRRLHSIALRADAHHLLTDVWTSVGVVVGIFLVKLTGWLVLDPIIAIAVAINIIWTGLRLLRETASGLLDRALPKEEQQTIQAVLALYHQQGIVFHALRTRMAGSRRFVSLHVLVPGEWTVQHGHNLCENIETEIAQSLPKTHVFTHLEPLEDPASWNDQILK